MYLARIVFFSALAPIAFTAEQYACQAAPDGGWSCNTSARNADTPPRPATNLTSVTGANNSILNPEGSVDSEGESDDDSEILSLKSPNSTQVLSELQSIDTFKNLDWVPNKVTSDAKKDQPRGVCKGGYVEPPRPGLDTMKSLEDSPTFVSAKASRYDKATETAILAGDVRLRHGSIQAEADEVRVNRSEAQGELTGNVRLREQGMLIVGDHAKVQLDSGTAQMDNAQYVLHEASMRGKAKHVERIEDGKIMIDDGTYTRCPPGDNSWALSGSKVELDPETGFGTARDATLDVGGIPVLYTPWIRFPIDDRRVSGFLMPSAGYSTNTGGFVRTPYYLNFSPNFDATLFPTYFAHRGLQLESQFRYLTEASEGTFGGSYLRDHDDSRDRQSLYSKNRWLVNWQDQTGLNSRLLGTVDFTKISDPYYFDDLDTNLGIDTPGYVNQQGTLTWRGDSYTARVNAQKYQMATIDDVTQYQRMPQITLDGQVPDDWNGLQMSYKTEAVRFHRNLRDGEYTDKDGDQTPWYDTNVYGLNRANAKRYNVAPRVTLPWENAYAYVKPSATYMHTKYDVDLDSKGKKELRAQNKNFVSSPSRSVPVFSVDSGLSFDRATNWFGTNYTQSLEPRAMYLYVPYRKQSDVPVFDSAESPFSYSYLWQENRFSGTDRIGDANQLSLGLTNRWLEEDGFERQRLSVGQSMYFSNRRAQMPGIDYRKRRAATTGVSPYGTEYMLQLTRNWRISSAYNWDPDMRKPRSAHAGFQFQSENDKRKIFNTTYRYLNDTAVYNPSTGEWQYGGNYDYYESFLRNSDGVPVRVNNGTPGSYTVKKTIKDYYKIEQQDTSFMWPVYKDWSMVGRWQFDYNRSRTLEAMGGLEYDNCCWKFRLINRYWLNYDENSLNTRVSRNEKPNRGIFVQVVFKGLGDAGSSDIGSMLSQSIQGYRDTEDEKK